MSLPPSPKILIARGDMLGDLVTATALIQPIKQQYPDARIFFLARRAFSELLMEIPDVDSVIDDIQPYDGKAGSPEFNIVLETIKRQNFDVMINLWERPRYAVLAKKAGIKIRIGHAIGWTNWQAHTHTVRLDYREYHRHKVQMNLALLRPLGIDAIDPKLRLNVSEQTMTTVQSNYPFMRDAYRVVAVDAGAKVKCLVDAEIKPVLRAMLEMDSSPIVLLGGIVANASQSTLDWIASIDRLIDLTGKTSLLEVSAIIKKATYFVGPDSGLSHIAAAFQCPAVVIYRTRTQNCFHWAPWLSPHVIYKQQNICPDSCNPVECVCLGRETISPERIEELIHQLNNVETGTLNGQWRYWGRMGHQAGIFCDKNEFETYRSQVPVEWNAIHLSPKSSTRLLKDQMVAANINLVVLPRQQWSLKLWVARMWTSNWIHFLPTVKVVSAEE